MKKIFLYLPFLLLTAACSKKGKFEQIKGVDLCDANNVSLGSLGEPDVFMNDENFAMRFYPNPAAQVQFSSFENKTSVDRSFRLTVVPAHFRNAPKRYALPSLPFEEPEEYKINIENLKSDPDEELAVHDFELAARSTTDIAFEFSNLKQGFYRVIVTFDDGARYWSNLWIFRPE